MKARSRTERSDTAKATTTVGAITYDNTADRDLNPRNKLFFRLAGSRGLGDPVRLSLRLAGEGMSTRLHLAKGFDFPDGTYWWWAREYGSVGALGWLKGGPVHVALVEEDRPIRPANGLSFVPRTDPPQTRKNSRQRGRPFQGVRRP